MINTVNIKVSDIELCKEYSDNPEKLRAIITDDSFKWSCKQTGGESNKYGSFYKYNIVIKYKGNGFSFDFNDSIANKTEGKTPDLYSILCCIRSDYSTAMDYPVLDDFAQEFCEGMKVSEIIEAHTETMKFARDISRVFTEEEIDSFPS